VLLEGSCWLLPARGEPIQLSIGDVVFVPHGAGYALADHPDSPLKDFRFDTAPAADAVAVQGAAIRLLCAAYYFDRSSSHPLLDDLPEVVHLSGRHPSLRAAIELLSDELTEPRAGSSAILTGLVDMLLMFVLRAWFADERATDGWATVLADPALMAALRGIHGSPQHPWTVAELATLSGMSRAGFAKRFTTAVGRTPLGYLTWWRMTLAARRLHESDVPLRTIAAQTGYGTEFALAKAFKREYGVAPGEYRRSRLTA